MDVTPSYAFSFFPVWGGVSGAAGGDVDPFGGVIGGAGATGGSSAPATGRVYEPLDSGWWSNATGGASGSLEVEANGTVYLVPSNSGWPPNGYYVMSPRVQEEWLLSVGATPIGRSNLTPEARQWLSQQGQPVSAQQAEAWRREQEQLNAGNVGLNFMLPSGMTLDQLKAIARAGGNAAQTALEELSKHGDLFAKVALSLGIGYGAVTVLLVVGAVGVGVVMLKK